MKQTLLFIIAFVLTISTSVGQKTEGNVRFTDTTIILHSSSGDLFGTLTRPTSGKNNLPLVVFVSGSGPTDRDGNTPFGKNNLLKQLADSLSLSGSSSFRFDKRGVGESKNAIQKEQDLLFDTYINDLVEWVSLLKKAFNYKKVTIAGHSEGSLIGMIAAKQADKFISLSGAGRSADLILKEQLAANGPKILEIATPIIDSLKNGLLVKDVNPMLNSIFRASVQPYIISWFKRNPQNEIAALNIPILIVQGTTDLQVSVDDANLLHKANLKSKLEIIPNVNHLFKNAPTDRQENLKTYSNPDLAVSHELIDIIKTFIANP